MNNFQLVLEDLSKDNYWVVYITANMSNGKISDLVSFPVYVKAKTREDILDEINKNKDRLYNMAAKAVVKDGMRVMKPIEKNVMVTREFEKVQKMFNIPDPKKLINPDPEELGNNGEPKRNPGDDIDAAELHMSDR